MKKLTLALCLSSFITPAAFAERFIYTGFSFGSSKFQQHSDKDSASIDNGSALSMHIGTNIMPALGAEIGYQGLFSSSPLNGYAFYANIQPRISLGTYQLYGSVGVNSFMLEDSSDIDNVIEERSKGIMLGAGVNVFIFNSFSVGLNYKYLRTPIEAYDLTGIHDLNIKVSVHFI